MTGHPADVVHLFIYLFILFLEVRARRRPETLACQREISPVTHVEGGVDEGVCVRRACSIKNSADTCTRPLQFVSRVAFH